MKIELKNLKQNPENPRIIRDEQFKKLVNSIKEFPEMLKVRRLVCTPDFVVLGGNMRLKALQEAGIKEIEVDVVDWDESKQRRFIIADNASFGEWNHEILANEWDLEELNSWGLDSFNFNQYSLDGDGGEVTDIKDVVDFAENVNFIIKCKDLSQMENLQNILGCGEQMKMNYDEFVKILKRG